MDLRIFTEPQQGASYDDQLAVPTRRGSMFEALMPTLVVPEEEWGPQSWAVTHPLYVESQIEFGLDRAGYGYWGFSPASDMARKARGEKVTYAKQTGNPNQYGPVVSNQSGVLHADIATHGWSRPRAST